VSDVSVLVAELPVLDNRGRFGVNNMWCEWLFCSSGDDGSADVLLRVRRVLVMLVTLPGSLRALRLRAVVTLAMFSLGVALRLDRVTRPDCGSASASSASRNSVLSDDSRVLRLCRVDGGGVVVVVVVLVLVVVLVVVLALLLPARDIELARLVRWVLMILRGDDAAGAASGVEFVTSLRGDLPWPRAGLSSSIAADGRLRGDDYSVHGPGTVTMSAPECSFSLSSYRRDDCYFDCGCVCVPIVYLQ
jgi:hypothetical protein